MSAAESGLVLGLVLSIITIFDTVKQISRTARNAKGVPEVFDDACQSLPFAENTLKAIRSSLAKQSTASPEGQDNGAVKAVLEGCKVKAAQLKTIFEKVLPGEDAGRLERYYNAVRTLGKGTKVEALTEGILRDVQSLVNDHAMREATATDMEGIEESIKKLAELKPSVPDSLFETEPGTSMTHYGSGDIRSNTVYGRQHNFQGDRMRNYFGRR